jgi:hypothetical protein
VSAASGRRPASAAHSAGSHAPAASAVGAPGGAGFGQVPTGAPHRAAPTPPPASTVGPVSRTTRDLTVLAAVVVVLAVLVRVGSSVEYAVPISLGTSTITNADDVIAEAEDALQQWVDAQATRVSEDAACYFFRPLGPTQGAVPVDMFPAELLPGMEDADAVDLLMCGPVELATEAMDTLPGMAPQPWLTGLVAYVEDPPGSYRGEFRGMLQSSLAVLTTAMGGVSSDQLVRANGHHPASGIVDDPDWREVTPTGEPPPGGATLPGGDDLPPGVTLPGGDDLPPGVTLPELPPDVTVPPDMSLPDLPGITVPQRRDVPGVPALPGASGG